MPKQYIFLLIAVLFEIMGSASVQASHQFTRLVPSVMVVVGFAGAFYFFSLVLEYMPLGIVYAIWSGLGIVLITAVGYVFFKQPFDLAAILGIGMIIAGIVVIQMFSTTTSH